MQVTSTEAIVVLVPGGYQVAQLTGTDRGVAWFVLVGAVFPVMDYDQALEAAALHQQRAVQARIARQYQ
jgi:hypothetical protein